MPPAPRISVALCTYNGGGFLQAQLDSLLAQARLPDEVVAFDDGSTDGTVERLQRFAAAAPFSVHVHATTDGLGPAKNFERAIAACVGDVIACCDQDDVWRGDKLAVIEAAFERQPDLAFVFSDAEAIDAAGKPLGYRLWDGVAFTPSLRRAVGTGRIFDVLLRYNVVTGATMAFASRLRPLVLPIGPGWMHDGWIALLAASTNLSAVAIPEPLIGYRQHVDQAQGVPPRTLTRQLKLAWTMPRDQFAKEHAAFVSAMHRFTMWHLIAGPSDPIALDSHAFESLVEKIDHMAARSAMRMKRRSRFASVRELLAGRYSRYSLGWKSFAQDLVL